MAENLNVSGVYVITNTSNGKVYVGSAVNVRRRWGEHRRTLRLGSHHSRTLQRAWMKYGEQSFHLHVVCVLTDKTGLVICEQSWLDKLRPFDPSRGYNINPTAQSRLGAKWTPERRAEFSASRKGFCKGKTLTHEHKQALMNGRNAAGFSEETRRKMSEAARARARPPLSEETKRKIGEANRGRKLPPVAESTRAKLSAAAKVDWQKRKNSLSN